MTINQSRKVPHFEVKNLIISTESIVEILRLMPQNDITTQSLSGLGG